MITLSIIGPDLCGWLHSWNRSIIIYYIFSYAVSSLVTSMGFGFSLKDLENRILADFMGEGEEIRKQLRFNSPSSSNLPSRTSDSQRSD